MSDSGSRPQRSASGLPKVFDVMRPDKVQASPTSRPVIVGHKPAVQDSTLTDKPSSLDAPANNHRPLLDSQEKVTIEPPARKQFVPPEESVDISAPEQPAPKLPQEGPTAPQLPEQNQPESAIEPEPNPTEPASSEQPEQSSEPTADHASSLPLDAVQGQPTTYTQPVYDTGSAQPVIAHHASPARGNRSRLLIISLIIVAVTAIAIGVSLGLGAKI